MNIAYFDCFSGISGDMIIGALLDAGLDIHFLDKELHKLNLKDYKIKAAKILKGGIAATQFNVIQAKRPQPERNLAEITRIIECSSLDAKIQNSIKKIFLCIATAEAKIHNQSINDIHFHELGAIDTIIDIAGVVIGLQKLGIEKIYCSKLNVGTGFVRFSHGTFPVPAPATTQILIDVPIYHNNINAELVTPTGAAIISTLASGFGQMPEVRVNTVGYGAGTKDLEQPNVLRVLLGQRAGFGPEIEHDTINIIETNIDNMNPEIYSHVLETLMDRGALDVYLTNIIMKKSRPAIKLTVLAELKNTDKLIRILFRETTTLGIRIYPAARQKLDREIKVIDTKYGPVKFKISKLESHIENSMPEYEECLRIAKHSKVPLKKVYEELKRSLYG